MSGAAFLRVEKLKGCGIIAVAARHNKRVIQAESGATGSIDSARSHLNYSLVGPSTAEAVTQLANDLMTAADIAKLRKDAVRGIEAVFSLPARTHIDTKAYFTDCLEWAAAYFGGMENLLSFDVHLDEAAPHAHALILPMINGQMNGGRMCGARSKMLDMQSQFHHAVAKRHGLRNAPAKMKGEAKHRAAAQVLAYLRETKDTALLSQAWPTIRGGIERDPGSFLLALGLVTDSVKPIKPFVDYVTSTGKGPRREREREREQLPTKSIDFQANDNGPKSIDFETNCDGLKSIDFSKTAIGKSEVYVSGDFAKPQRTKAPPPVPKQAAPQRQTTNSQTQPATSNERDTDEESRLLGGTHPGNSIPQQSSTSGINSTVATLTFDADDDGEDF